MSITNRDIYKNALSIIGERVSDNSSDDYEERTEYILPTFYCTARSIDRQIRKAEGNTAPSSFNTVRISLDDEFPLSDSFVSTAALYLAAMLVIDEDQELSDAIYDKYCDSLASIAAYASCEPISQKYFFG